MVIHANEKHALRLNVFSTKFCTAFYTVLYHKDEKTKSSCVSCVILCHTAWKINNYGRLTAIRINKSLSSTIESIANFSNFGTKHRYGTFFGFVFTNIISYLSTKYHKKLRKCLMCKEIFRSITTEIFWKIIIWKSNSVLNVDEPLGIRKHKRKLTCSS